MSKAKFRVILAATLLRPVEWRTRDDHAQIAGLVSELEDLRAVGFLVRMFHLALLAFSFGENLVVGHLLDEVCNACSERLGDDCA